MERILCHRLRPDFAGRTVVWARVMQHEIDHLNGVLVCDHGDPIKPQSTNESG